MSLEGNDTRNSEPVKVLEHQARMMRTERGRGSVYSGGESGDQYEDSLQGERGESIEITFIKLGWSGIW